MTASFDCQVFFWGAGASTSKFNLPLETSECVEGVWDCRTTCRTDSLANMPHIIRGWGSGREPYASLVDDLVIYTRTASCAGKNEERHLTSASCCTEVSCPSMPRHFPEPEIRADHVLQVERGRATAKDW